MKNVDPSVMQSFINWLHFHEHEIANDYHDMGKLNDLFHHFFGRSASDSPRDDMYF